MFCDNYILTEVELFGSFYLNFQFTPLYGLNLEKLLFDENIHYVHLIVVENEGFPEHFTNSNVYMTILRGRVTLNIADQGFTEYGDGTMIAIPNNTKMHIQNLHKEPLEVIIVKAPVPKE